jgi:hypothetical protein
MRIPFDHLLAIFAPPVAIIQKINFTSRLNNDFSENYQKKRKHDFKQ